MKECTKDLETGQDGCTAVSEFVTTCKSDWNGMKKIMFNALGIMTGKNQPQE
jgi:hypothetical protein